MSCNSRCDSGTDNVKTAESEIAPSQKLGIIMSAILRLRRGVRVHVNSLFRYNRLRGYGTHKGMGQSSRIGLSIYTVRKQEQVQVGSGISIVVG